MSPNIGTMFSLPLTFTATVLMSSIASAQLFSGENCSTFTWNQEPGYTLTSPDLRVSKAITCPPSLNDTQACPLVASGDQEVTWSYNLTIPDSSWTVLPSNQPVSYYYNLIFSSINSSLSGIPWGFAVIGSISTTQALSPNTSAYINFTPYKRCFVGTLGGCTGDILDGTPMEACAPVYHTVQGIPILDGNYTIVEVPEENVSQYPDPFAGEVNGDVGGAARRLRVSGMLLGLGVLASLLFL